MHSATPSFKEAWVTHTAVTQWQLTLYFNYHPEPQGALMC